MRLFDETANKYYELISYLLSRNETFTGEDVDRLYAELYSGEKDYETMDLLFPDKAGREILFEKQNGSFAPVVSHRFPVRMSLIEQQAFGFLYRLKYADDFLSEQTLHKIRKADEKITKGWTPEDIYVKNQFAVEERAGKDGIEKKIPIIDEAIRRNVSIVFDNIKEGVYEYRDTTAFPVRIEYSFVNDVFRVSAFLPSENRFFKMTLDTMHNIRIGTWEMEGLEEEYHAFLDSCRKHVVLDVEPFGHVIERCFRIFSYYERKAVYNREEKRYRLEIYYHSFDEAEVVRDILSLGSSVVVTGPEKLRIKVYRRILKAKQQYTDNTEAEN